VRLLLFSQLIRMRVRLSVRFLLGEFRSNESSRDDRSTYIGSIFEVQCRFSF
jgi:hypothetical protein